MMDRVSMNLDVALFEVKLSQISLEDVYRQMKTLADLSEQ